MQSIGCFRGDTGKGNSFFIFDDEGHFTGAFHGPDSTAAYITMPYSLLSDPLLNAETTATFKKLLSDGSDEAVVVNPAPYFITPAKEDESIRAGVLKDGAGKVTGLWMGIFSEGGQNEDIRAFSELADELKTRLKIQEDYMESFVYSISHDLKSPLLTVEGMVDLIMSDTDSQLSERSRVMAERLKANTEKAARMINDLLELSRVGRMDNTAEPLSLKITARQIASCIEGRNRFGRISTVFEGDEAEIHFPLKRLAQLFKSLLDNSVKALKDTPEGRISITIKKGPDYATVSLADNGCGIEPAYHDEIFLPFRRLPYFKEYQGTGMGLPLAKAIIEKNGGRMWLESKPAVGTTIFFTIPLLKKTAG